jgi:hypothetical protein
MDLIRKGGGPVVKRVLALCLVALLTLFAAGCSTLEQAAGTAGPTDTPAPEAQTAQPAPTTQPTPTPIPTPEPTLVPVVAVSDYQYQKVDNKALGVSFDYPSHWANVPGNITICYVQPVNPGETPARVAVSVKKTKTLDADGVRRELDKLVDSISGNLQNFRHSSVSKKVKLLGLTAFSLSYQAQLDGQAVKGFVITTYKGSRNRLYALHFYAPSDQYDDFQTVLKQVMDSLELS